MFDHAEIFFCFFIIFSILFIAVVLREVLRLAKKILLQCYIYASKIGRRLQGMALLIAKGAGRREKCWESMEKKQQFIYLWNVQMFLFPSAGWVYKHQSIISLYLDECKYYHISANIQHILNSFFREYI